MDAKLLVTVLGILLGTATCQSSPEPPAADNNFVPGVFIPADALKSLKEKAMQADNNAGDTQTEPPKVSKKSDQISEINLPEQGYQPNQPIPDQQINQNNQQNYPPNQQAYANQPGINQPAYSNQQPVLFNQQPGFNPQYGYQQPGYQQLGYQQPGYQQDGMVQPFLSNQQAILVAQQPGYQNQQGMLVNQQPTYQQPMLVAQQPNQQLFIPNGQIPQTNMIGNPSLAGGQPTIIGNNPGNGVIMANPGQGQSNIYAMVPINNQNTIPNPNLGNNNAYFVPVQQVPQNAFLMNNGK